MSQEVHYYGIHACLALASKRPIDILRVYLEESNLKTFAPLLKWCANHRKAYHLVSSADLEKLTKTVHHEGICIKAKEPSPLQPADFVNHLPSRGCILYLDGVENPHNVGSIVRTAAHFNIYALVGENVTLTPSACRIAKGGSEVVNVLSSQKPLEILKELKRRGFTILATSAHEGESLYQISLPPRTVFAIGSESKGLNKATLRHISSSVKIQGSGAVESLNVSVAAALCMGEYCRQYG